MLINDVKKGMRVRLANGWYGTMADNAKGNIRMVDVEGIFREIGSVYSHEIVLVRTQEAKYGLTANPQPELWEKVELSPAQQKKASNIKAMGF